MLLENNLNKGKNNSSDHYRFNKLKIKHIDDAYNKKIKLIIRKDFYKIKI